MLLDKYVSSTNTMPLVITGEVPPCGCEMHILYLMA